MLWGSRSSKAQKVPAHSDKPMQVKAGKAGKAGHRIYSNYMYTYIYMYIYTYIYVKEPDRTQQDPQSVQAVR